MFKWRALENTELQRYVDKILKFSQEAEALYQFQPNLAHSILEWRGLKFEKIMGDGHFQREMIIK